ncbi:hypothetical protein M9Y10_039973 [Tritrichomonas musculus]|uniref:ABC transporter domain-containing protein n=1 Tax=Tritrichomonas musculus TaxID=1915356 RepID=A0ABR2GQD7_9EUKA
MNDHLLDNSRSETSIVVSKKTGTSGRIIRALFKKSFLIKIRHPATILEFLFACVVWLVLFPAWKLGRVKIKGSINPPLNFTSIIPYKLIMFFLVTKNSSLVFLPDCSNTRSLYKMWNDSISLIPSNYTNNITFEASFANSVEEMKTLIYSQTSNGYGIYWSNAKDDTALTSPKIETYRQSLGLSPDDELFELLYRSIAYMNGFSKIPLALTNTSYQQYATADSEMLLDMSILVMIMIIMPIIISTMPDLQTILEEKDSRVMALSFLMGCNETSYWFVSFTMQFLLSFFPYLFMSFYFCFSDMMKGTSFSLLMLINILFIISHVWFLMFFTTFMKKASSSRMLTAIFMVFGVFFAYLHFFFTLDDSNHNEAVKHVFSIIPLSAYQLIVVTMYQQSRTTMPPITWSNFLIKKNPLLKYQPWYSVMWLSIDSFLYFILFVFFNMVNPREFGSPPLSWNELFKLESWKRLFNKKKNKKKNNENYDLGFCDDSFTSVSSLVPVSSYVSNSFLIHVDGLSKTYYGYRVVKALDDVSFTINQNEIIVVIGPNGAGKSTLINILAGAIEPSEGTLRILGGNPTNRFVEMQDILGVCFQENVLINLLTIEEHFELFGAFRGIQKNELNEKMMFFTNLLQLNEMIKNRAGDLSGGQKRKLCISLSLLGDPPVVIMDEPTAGVDVQSRQLIWKTIASLKNTTTIVTSHALEEAEAVSSRLFVVSGGKIPFVGTATELRNQFKCGYVLRVDGDVHNVFQLAREFEPNAHMSVDRNDTIELPVSRNVASFMEMLEKRKNEIGVNSFSFSVEQLEDVLLKLIQNDEAGFNNVQ